MLDWTSGYVSTNGITIHYTRSGGPGPPVLLAHGFSDNGRCWTPVAEVLQRQYDVVMYDARGHGYSSAPEEGYRSEDRVADLAGLIGALGLERPHLVGHSMGAATVAMLAAFHPELARSVVLEDPPWGAPGPARTPEQEQAWLDQRRHDLMRNKARSRDELIALARAHHPGWSEAELGPWADAKRELSLNIIGILSAPGLPWQQVVQRIECPLLLLTGDVAAGALVNPEAAAQLVQLARHGRLVHIAGAGHAIRRDRLHAFMQALRGFLDEHAGAGF